jgi:hypothetical protein
VLQLQHTTTTDPRCVPEQESLTTAAAAVSLGLRRHPAQATP